MSKVGCRQLAAPVVSYALAACPLSLPYPLARLFLIITLVILLYYYIRVTSPAQFARLQSLTRAFMTRAQSPGQQTMHQMAGTRPR